MKTFYSQEKVSALETGYVYILRPLIARSISSDFPSNIRDVKVAYINQAPKEVVKFRHFHKYTIILPVATPYRYEYLVDTARSEDLVGTINKAFAAAEKIQYDELTEYHRLKYRFHADRESRELFFKWDKFTNMYAECLWTDFQQHMHDQYWHGTKSDDKYPEYFSPCDYDRMHDALSDSSLIRYVLSEDKNKSEYVIAYFERKYGKPFFKEGKIIGPFWNELDRYKQHRSEEPELRSVVADFAEYLVCKDFMETYGDLSLRREYFPKGSIPFWYGAAIGVVRAHEEGPLSFYEFISSSPQLRLLSYYYPSEHIRMPYRLYTDSEIKEHQEIMEKLLESNGNLATVLATIKALDHQEMDKEAVYHKWLIDIRCLSINLNRDRNNNLEISFNYRNETKVLKGGEFQYVNTCYLMYLIKDVNCKEEFRGKADLFIDRFIECYWGDHCGTRSRKSTVFEQWCVMWERKGFVGTTNKAVGAVLHSMGFPKHLICAFHIPDNPFLSVRPDVTLINRDRLKSRYEDYVLPEANKRNPGSRAGFRGSEWSLASGTYMKPLDDLCASKNPKTSASRSSIPFVMPTEYYATKGLPLPTIQP